MLVPYLFAIGFVALCCFGAACCCDAFCDAFQCTILARSTCCLSNRPVEVFIPHHMVMSLSDRLGMSHPIRACDTGVFRCQFGRSACTHRIKQPWPRGESRSSNDAFEMRTEVCSGISVSTHYEDASLWCQFLGIHQD